MSPIERIARDELFALLRRTRAASAERRLAGHEEDLTILATDSAGFSRKTFEHGVVRFLANMTRVYDRVVPLIERHGGAVTTQNADNVLAVFARPHDAVAAALDIQALLARRNARASGEDRYELCLACTAGYRYARAGTTTIGGRRIALGRLRGAK